MISMFIRGPAVLASAQIATHWPLLVHDNMIYLIECLVARKRERGRESSER